MASTTELVVTNSIEELTIKEKPKTFKTMTIKERFSYIRELITVEPILGSYVTAAVLCSASFTALEYEKSCRVNSHFNDDICYDIIYGSGENYSKEVTEVQVNILNMHSWQVPLTSAMPLILILFLGSYSDRHKIRKPFILLPIIGELVSLTACFFCVVFMRSWNLEVLGVCQTVISSLFGGQPMLVMAIFAYIADISSVEMRTLRIGIVQVVLNVCFPISQAITTPLYHLLGYYGVFSISLVLYIFAIVYGLFCVKEPKVPQNVTKKGLLCDIFDPKHALDTFNLLLKKSEGNNRLYISLIMFFLFIFNVVVVGESNIILYYCQAVLGYPALDFLSYFQPINTVVHLIGTSIGIPLLSSVLKISDLIILLLTFLDKMIANVVFAFAKQISVMYIGVFVSFITGISIVAIRSMATKVVSEKDLGKAQSIFGICEAIGAAVAAPLYNKLIYAPTIEIYPAAFFWVSILLKAIACILIVWMYFRQKSEKVASSNFVSEKPVVIDDVQVTHM